MNGRPLFDNPQTTSRQGIFRDAPASPEVIHPEPRSTCSISSITSSSTKNAVAPQIAAFYQGQTA